MDCLMGIDLGSTSIKAIVYDTGGKLLAAGSVPTEVSHLDKDHPEWAFWDPEVIWQSVVRATGQALAALNDGSRIKAVAVTGWGMDGVPLDRDGNVLYPFISWHCARTQPQSEAFSGRIGPERLFSITGTQVMAIHTVYRMLWLKEHAPQALEKASVWVSIEDYINFRLSGEIATEFSMASCTALVDQKSRTWSDELIGEAGLPRSIFPEITPSGTKIGTVTAAAARETGLDPGTAVVLGGHDYHCAGLAVGAFRPEVIMDITGTWEILFAGTPEANLAPEVYKSGLLLESHVVRDCYNYAAYALSAGMLEWYKDHLCAEEHRLAAEKGGSVWDVLMESASRVQPGSQGVFFLPHFSGAVTPNPDPKSLGAFVGMNESIDRACLTRAVIEGLDYQFRQLVDSFEFAMNRTVDRIIAVGGTTRNTFWMQNKADVSGKVLEVPDIEEATPLGAALLAGIGVGLYRDEADAHRQVYKRGATYEPDPAARGRYEEYYGIYKEIYPALKGVSHRIFSAFRA